MPLNSADPLLRMLPPDATPDLFATLPPDQQARRGRAYLVFWSMGYDAWAAWRIALDDTLQGNELIDYTVGRAPDVEIPKMVQARIAWDAEVARQNASA